MVKAFNLPIDYLLYELSYVNMMMYSSVLPSYDNNNDGDEQGEQIDADDPQNRDKIRQMLFE